jgi:hypothetical protein
MCLSYELGLAGNNEYVISKDTVAITDQHLDMQFYRRIDACTAISKKSQIKRRLIRLVLYIF